MIFVRPIIALLLPIIAFLGCKAPDPDQKASIPTLEQQREPSFALQGLEVADGLTAQLFAAEPLVRNPSNIDIDHRGRVWVVENVNYRPENNPDNPYQEGGDMVVILEDTDGDAKADDRKVFFQDELVDGAMGICVLDNKVYLSSSPYIVVLTDTDRDDQADQIDTLFDGMGQKQGDHNVHAMSIGPDGRLYFNFGNSAGKMLDKEGRHIVDQRGHAIKYDGNPYWGGMVFRCAPDGTAVECLGHNFRNNYEVCVDAFGRMWQSDNDDDGNKSVRINYVMEYGNYGYRDELTGAHWSTARSGWNSEIPHRHWHQNDPGVIPNLFITGSGSPCGMTIYEGKLLPAIFQGQIIHADAGPGSIWSFPVAADGAGFSAELREILMRKTDAWYRPTDVCVAPDGSLFGSDWYDPGVGGHWAGDAARGRIYRITVPSSERYQVVEKSIDDIPSAIQALRNPNAATRYLGWQTLVAAGEEAESKLIELWNDVDPRIRARALWLLGKQSIQHVITALSDADPLIRETGVRVARQIYPQQLPKLLTSILDDPSAGVRREAAIALVEVSDAEVPALWSALAQQHDGKDRWYLEALGIAADGRWESCLAAWLTDHWNSEAGRDIIWRSRGPQSLNLLITLLHDRQIPLHQKARYLRATDFLDRQQVQPKLADLLAKLPTEQDSFKLMILTHLTPEFARASTQVRGFVSSIISSLRGTEAHLNLATKLDLQEESEHLIEFALANATKESGIRAAQTIVRWQGWSPFEKLATSGRADDLIPILGAINQGGAKDILIRLVGTEKTQDKELSKKAITALAQDWGWERRVIALLDMDNVPTDLRVFAATKLVNAARQVDRDKGLEYLAKHSESPVASELAPISDLVAQDGDAASGEKVFSTFCQNCHQVNGQGVAFGPDLSDIGNKLGKDGLYTSIIYPSAAINHGFEGLHLHLKDGSHHTGFVLSEGNGEIQLRLPDGQTRVVPISDIIKREALESSLMTPGLAQMMGQEKLIDLVSYLQNLVDHSSLAENPFQGKIYYERGQ